MVYQWWTFFGGTTISFINVEDLEIPMLCLTNGQTAILTNVPCLESNKRLRKERNKDNRKWIIPYFHIKKSCEGYGKQPF